MKIYVSVDQKLKIFVWLVKRLGRGEGPHMTTRRGRRQMFMSATEDDAGKMGKPRPRPESRTF